MQTGSLGSRFFSMLDNLLHIINGLQALDTEKEIITIVDHNKERLTELQKEQMLEGRGIDGEYIRPFYSENPYFKSRESADRYAKWKQKVTPNPKRPLDVPNLIVTGTLLHDKLMAKVMGNVFEIEPTNAKGKEIFNEHPNAQGLDEEKRLDFAVNITLPQFGYILEEKTGLKL